MSDSRKFEFEGRVSPSEAADVLIRIAEGIRARGLSLSRGEDRITVRPSGALSLEVEARAKKRKARIELAIGWGHPEDDPA